MQGNIATYLEAVALFPQMTLTWTSKGRGNLGWEWLIVLGLCRFIQVSRWLYYGGAFCGSVHDSVGSSLSWWWVVLLALFAYIDMVYVYVTVKKEKEKVNE
jgi:hypothetical protein